MSTLFVQRWHFLLSDVLFMNEWNIDAEWVGIAAGVFTSASLLPQLIKLIRNKKSEDISLIFLLVLFCGLGLWIWYGFMRDDVPIIATNCFSLIINTLIIVLGIRYKSSDANRPS